MDREVPSLELIRERIAELVVRRLTGLTEAEASEYAELIRLEAEALADRRADAALTLLH